MQYWTVLVLGEKEVGVVTKYASISVQTIASADALLLWPPLGSSKEHALE